MGSSNGDQGYSIAVDGSDNVYVVGHSYVTWGAPLNAHTGWLYDVLVAKLNASGALQWHTFLGSGDEDIGWGIAVDDSGNVYVTGQSGATWGSPRNAYVGGADAFVAKFDSDLKDIRGMDRIAETPIFDVFVGDIFTYSIEIKNPFEQAYFRVKDTLDAALDYVLGSFTVNGTPSGDDAFNNDELLYETDGMLDVGAPLSLSFKVQVQNVPVGTLIDNTAWITAYTDETTLAEIEAIAPQAHVVPEPSTLLLVNTGLLGILVLVRRKIRKR